MAIKVGNRFFITDLTPGIRLPVPTGTYVVPALKRMPCMDTFLNVYKYKYCTHPIQVRVQVSKKVNN